MSSHQTVIQASPGTRGPVAQTLKWLAHPYYIGHFTALLLFPAMRALALHWRRQSPLVSERSYLHALDSLMEYETETAAILAVMLSLRFLRRSTTEQFVDDLLAYGKAAAAAMLLSIDMRAVFWYLVFLSCLTILFPRAPPYQGPSKLEPMTAAELKEKVLDDKSPEITWIVAACATWSPACVALEPMFARLSLKYTTERLRFVKVDVGRWPNAAKSLKVAADAVSPQLPSLILFQGSMEHARIPHVYKNGSVAKGRYRWADVVKGFDLDNRYKKSLKPQGKGDSGQKASGSAKKKK